MLYIYCHIVSCHIVYNMGIDKFLKGGKANVCVWRFLLEITSVAHFNFSCSPVIWQLGQQKIGGTLQPP